MTSFGDLKSLYIYFVRLTIEPIELGTSVNRSTERSWRQECLLQEDFGDIISLSVRLIISNACYSSQ